MAGQGLTADDRHTAERFNHRAFLEKYADATTITRPDRELVHIEGDAADALYYVIEGIAKITGASAAGKQGIIALFGPGSFFGKDCLYATRRVVTVSALGQCSFMRIPRDLLVRAIREDPDFARSLLAYAVRENAQLRDELIDHLLHSSEKRLARILLTLADLAPDEESRLISIPLTQETLSQMVGTTRARINQFMSKFRRHGHIDYDGRIRVRSSLQNIIASDQHPREVD
jgi:CRP/FNR family cyclic AMP-dependent transcriptional regulator